VFFFFFFWGEEEGDPGGGGGGGGGGGVRLGKKGGCEQEERPLSVCQFGLNGEEKKTT